MKYRWCGDHEDDTLYQNSNGANVDNESISLSMDCSTPPPSNKESLKLAFDFIAKLRSVQPKHLLFHRRRLKRYSCKTGVFIVTVALVYLQLSGGIFQRCFLERDFSAEFSFHQDIDNFHDVIQRYADHKTVPDGFNPPPENTKYANISFLQSPRRISTNESIGLLIIVKSATKNFKKRRAIRKTWGNPQYLKENIIKPDLATEVVFICGIPNESHNTSELFVGEQHYDDIVLAQFQDSYENNTYKTVLAMRWAVEFIGNFKYLMIVDDDMYVNLANAILFLRGIPTMQVQAVTSNDSGVTAFYPVNQLSTVCPSTLNISLADKPLIMGQLIVDAKPFRSSFGLGSKWSMSMKDYPYNYFPPYIAGGATLLDSKTVSLLYYGSFFTRHFWVDDVYLGIIAHKLGITLTNNDFIDSSYRLYYRQTLAQNFYDIIALHGLKCPEQLEQLWESRDVESMSSCYNLSENL